MMLGKLCVFAFVDSGDCMITITLAVLKLAQGCFDFCQWEITFLFNSLINPNKRERLKERMFPFSYETSLVAYVES